MKILGLSFYYHDAAACILDNGKIIAAAEEERFSRKKHDSDFPKLAVQFCLEEAGIKNSQLDYVVFYEKPFVKFERILLQTLAVYPHSAQFFIHSMKEWVTKKLYIKQHIAEKLDIPSEKIQFSDHHISHAASAYYPSPFTEAAVLTLDGVGEWSVGSIGIGKDNDLQLVKELRFPHSLGLLYSTFTAFLGFEVNEGEYKVMGMAPYGKPIYEDKIKKIVSVKDDGSFQLDLSYFTFHSSPHKSFNNKFEDLFGKPRNPKKLFFTERTGYPKFWGEKPEDYKHLMNENQKYADIAASIQKVTEDIIVKICQYSAKETGMKNLCLAGGVALNGLANQRIVKETPFKNIFIQPAAGDSGGALGAALYLYHHILGNKKRVPMTHVYFGKQYTLQEIKQELKNKNIPYHEYKNDKLLFDEITKKLMEKQVIGWFQSRFEWGPRALGNRSILADPRHADMKDIVNSKIKFREPYRPFAPVVLEEHAKEYFEIDNVKTGPAKFMNIVVPVKKEMAKKIPAVTHEGTARLQAIDLKTNPRYYSVIKTFYEKTGVPVLLNTSFNLRGEPIVNTPADAISTFLRSGIDVLVLETFVVYKNEISEKSKA